MPSSPIFLGGGQSGVEYNFGELVPAGIRGHVRLSDPDGNCFTACAANACTVERPLAGVTVRLLDGQGRTLVTATTDARGEYRFDGLRPGTYGVAEETPGQLIDGAERVGTIAGRPAGTLAGNDLITQITLASGQSAIDYDFCEHEAAALSGFVYHDRNNNGLRESGEEGLGQVPVSLLDAAGRTLAGTVTDANGAYAFRGLSAGVYAIVETQPADWVDGLDRAGQIGGRDRGPGGQSRRPDPGRATPLGRAGQRVRLRRIPLRVDFRPRASDQSLKAIAMPRP